MPRSGSSSFGSKLNMAFHIDFPLIGIERSALVQDRLEYADLADVVGDAAKTNFLDPAGPCKADGPPRSSRHSLKLFIGVALREIDLSHPQRERADVDARYPPEAKGSKDMTLDDFPPPFTLLHARRSLPFPQRPRKLFDSAVNFHERVRPRRE